MQLTSDISRKLKSETFQPSSTITIDVPRDTVIKHLLIKLEGSVEVTYASGSPVSDSTSTMNRLINYIDVTAGGSFTIKNVRPWMLHMQNLMATSNFGVRRSQAGASATKNITADGQFAIGTTGQITSCVEAVLLSFENVMAGKGRTSTFWDTRGLASATLKFSTAAFANVLQAGSDAATFSDDNFEINVETIETQNIPKNAVFSTWKQTTQSIGFSSETSEFRQRVNQGNFLQGFLFQVRNGDAAKTLNNRAVSDIKFIINGSNYVQNTTFQELQNKNRSRYGLNAPYQSDESILDGVAYLDLLTPTAGEKYGSLGTAQDVRSPNVDEVQLGITTTNEADYTNNVGVEIMTNEIVRAVENQK